MLRCPHCQQEIELRIVTGPAVFGTQEGAYSTTARVDQAQAILTGDGYHPNPVKVYRTPESQRRAGLARYYRNREQVLQRAREQRAARKKSGSG